MPNSIRHGAAGIQHDRRHILNGVVRLAELAAAAIEKAFEQNQPVRCRDREISRAFVANSSKHI
ncbi:MAG TPA: hypothetical protein VK081_03075, partial [Planctomycetota bacterium]|nr:hypothetical protein [Planctomycetota bacterium]